MSNFRNIRVPVEVAERLEALGAEILDHYEVTGRGLEGVRGVDFERVERVGKLPPWVAVAKSLKDYEQHRQRSRRAVTHV